MAIHFPIRHRIAWKRWERDYVFHFFRQRMKVAAERQVSRYLSVAEDCGMGSPTDADELITDERHYRDQHGLIKTLTIRPFSFLHLYRRGIDDSSLLRLRSTTLAHIKDQIHDYELNDEILIEAARKLVRQRGSGGTQVEMFVMEREAVEATREVIGSIVEKRVGEMNCELITMIKNTVKLRVIETKMGGWTMDDGETSYRFQTETGMIYLTYRCRQ